MGEIRPFTLPEVLSKDELDPTWDDLALKIEKYKSFIPAIAKLAEILGNTKETNKKALRLISKKIDLLIQRRKDISLNLTARHAESKTGQPISEKEKMTLEKLKKILEYSIANGELLGEGLTARVYSDPNEDTRCYKIIHNNTLYARGNTVHLEANIQSDLADINHNHTRSPKAYYSARSDDFQIIVMEKLNAQTLKDIIAGKYPMPKTFDKQTFYANLTSFVTAMHERNIYHRDLHEGNIMVDNETGLPYIIDYGLACQSFGDENPYLQINTGTNKATTFTNDDDSLKNIQLLLNKFSRKNN